MVRLNRATVRGLFLYNHLRYGDGGTLKAVRRDSSLGSDPNPPPRLWFRRTVSTLAVDQTRFCRHSRSSTWRNEKSASIMYGTLTVMAGASISPFVVWGRILLGTRLEHQADGQDFVCSWPNANTNNLRKLGVLRKCW